MTAARDAGKLRLKEKSMFLWTVMWSSSNGNA